MFQYLLIQNIDILFFRTSLFKSQCHNDLQLRSTSKIEEIERNDEIAR